ncbi:unnamed protein product [Tetraodon nigroviridis]|uniref:(spotted green pufferfish) hypothetical protein n=1 Tax=Tetraodon nigroviridis TaxID=99883 RepID=Q4S5D7_TETNG|nr:unnamed protein product [Tetraodon nigroviridis]
MATGGHTIVIHAHACRSPQRTETLNGQCTSEEGSTDVIDTGGLCQGVAGGVAVRAIDWDMDHAIRLTPDSLISSKESRSPRAGNWPWKSSCLFWSGLRADGPRFEPPGGLSSC